MGSSELPRSTSVNFNGNSAYDYKTFRNNIVTPPQRTKQSLSGSSNRYNTSPESLRPYTKAHSLAPPSISSSGSTIFSNTKKQSTLYSSSERDDFDGDNNMESGFRKMSSPLKSNTLNVNPQTRQFLDDFELDSDGEEEEDDDTEEAFVTEKAAHNLGLHKSKSLKNIDIELNELQETFENHFQLVHDTPQDMQKPFHSQQKPFMQQKQNHAPFLLQPKSMMNLRPNNGSSFKLASPKKDVKEVSDKLESLREIRKRISQPQLPRYKSMSNLKANTISSNGNQNARKLKNKQSFASFGTNNYVSARAEKNKILKFQDDSDNFHDDTFGDDFDNQVLPTYMTSSPTKRDERVVNVADKLSVVNNNAQYNQQTSERGSTEDMLVSSVRARSDSRNWRSKKQHLESFREEDAEDSTDWANTHKSFRKPSNIQLLKQEIASNTPITKGKMVYNPDTLKWEGNVEVLNQFPENSKPRSLKPKSSFHNSRTNDSKLKRSESTLFSKYSNLNKNGGLKSRKVVGNMQFDSKNQRWISLHGDSGEIDPFKNIEDQALAQSSDYGASRFPSSATDSNLHRHTSSSSAGVTGFNGGMYMRGVQLNPTFVISSKRLEVFYHEENKWLDKLSGWVNESTEDSHLDGREYAYEIRNMVLNSTK